MQTHASWSILEVKPQPHSGKQGRGNKDTTESTKCPYELISAGPAKQTQTRTKPRTKTQRITLNLCLLFLHLTLVLQSSPSPQNKTNKQANQKKKRNLFPLSPTNSHLPPPQTAALTQDKPALAASGSQSALWLIDPAPEPNVNKGLTLLSCLKKKRKRKRQLCEVLVNGAAGIPLWPWQSFPLFGSFPVMSYKSRFIRNIQVAVCKHFVSCLKIKLYHKVMTLWYSFTSGLWQCVRWLCCFCCSLLLFCQNIKCRTYNTSNMHAHIHIYDMYICISTFCSLGI